MSLIWILLLISMLFQLTQMFFYSWFITTLNYVQAQFLEQAVATINVISKFVKWMNLLVHYLQRLHLGFTSLQGGIRLVAFMEIKTRMLSYIHLLSARNTWWFHCSWINWVNRFTLRLLYDITYSVNIRKNLEHVQPTVEALWQKVKRSYYVAYVLKHALDAHPFYPDPTSFGWVLSEDTLAAIATEDLLAPSKMIELTMCSCSTNCLTNRCRCKKYNLVCTDICRCC